MAITPFRRVLVANRGEIAIRVFRACTELGHPHRRHLQRRGPLPPAPLQGGRGVPGRAGARAGRGVPGHRRDHRHRQAARRGRHPPGLRLPLRERATFARRRCEQRGIRFVGPTPEVLDAMGDKVGARKTLAAGGRADGARAPRTGVDDGRGGAQAFADEHRLPGHDQGELRRRRPRHARRARAPSELAERARRGAPRGAERRSAAGGVPREYIERRKHIEVQILGDAHGNLVHLYERDCSVQRRHQKVVEIAPALNAAAGARGAHLRRRRCSSCASGRTTAARARSSSWSTRRGDFYFIEVNPRIQVEHTVTEVVTGIDLVQSQILIAEGHALHEPPRSASPARRRSSTRGVAMQCRVTTEDPGEQLHARLRPHHGLPRRPAGFGIRLDGGNGFGGARHHAVLRLAAGEGHRLRRSTFEDARAQGAERALREFRIRGVKTNIAFLRERAAPPDVPRRATHHTTLHRRDAGAVPVPRRAATARRKLLQLPRATSSSTATRRARSRSAAARCSCVEPRLPVDAAGSRRRPARAQMLQELGPERFAEWVLRSRSALLLTDTTMRDAHQSLLATRDAHLRHAARSRPPPRTSAPDLFSLEMWGGATFDTAYAVPHEDPWERLERAARARCPNILFQMLLRGANAVGYTSYPDNVVERLHRARRPRPGIDVFRDLRLAQLTSTTCRSAIDAVRRRPARSAEAAICYTGDIPDPKRTKYTLEYYVDLAKEHRRTGRAHPGIKDMAGLLKPRAATDAGEGAQATRSTCPSTCTRTTPAATASPRTWRRSRRAWTSSTWRLAHGGPDVPAVAERAGVRAARAPARHRARRPSNFAAAGELLGGRARVLRPFEGGLKRHAAEVYHHEMPGGQYSNLRQQAEALGLGRPLERREARLRRGQPAVRRHRQGDAVVQGRRRHGAFLMVQHDLTRAAVPRARRGAVVPGVGGRVLRGGARPAAGRLPRAAATKVLKGAKPMIEGRPGAACRRPTGPPRSASWSSTPASVRDRDMVRPRSTRGVARVHEHRRCTATSRCCRRRLSSTACARRGAWIDIEPGKTLIVKLPPIGELEPMGAPGVLRAERSAARR